VLILSIGMLSGALAALLATLPRLLEPGSTLPWGSLFILLSLIFITGVLASALATHLGLRAPLIHSLRTE
jgi:hypothetical protein